VATLLDTLQTSTSGNTTTISLAIPEQQLEQLLNGVHPHARKAALQINLGWRRGGALPPPHAAVSEVRWVKNWLHDPKVPIRDRDLPLALAPKRALLASTEPRRRASPFSCRSTRHGQIQPVSP